MNCLHFQRGRAALPFAVTVIVAMLVALRAEAQGVYDDKVWVEADTRLDWAYPLVGTSPADPPLELLKGYESTAQTYELFGPTEEAAGGKLPLVIFVSPQDRPVAWQFLEATCQAHGVVFASAREMGNGRPAAHRVRAVLDVLDDVRERFPIDPDRTYLVGFSGGAHIACLTAFALPEYFGGVACIGHAVGPPETPWELARVRDRLSVAIINGEHDPAAPLAEDMFIPWWKGVGVRMEPVTLRRRGHTMPPPEVFEAAFEWLEGGVAERRAAANKRPALRIADAPSREEWAQRVLADAEAQLAVGDAASTDAGLTQLEGLIKRWPDVPAAATAKELLADHASRADRPWEAIRAATRREAIRLQAEGYEALARDGRRAVRDQRNRHAQAAIVWWHKLRTQGDDAELASLAEERIAALTKIVDETPANAEAGLFPLRRVRFEMNGDVTLLEGIEHMRSALARVGYELRADETALRAAGVDLEKVHRPRISAGTLDDIDRKFFRRAGVRMRRVEGVVEIVAIGSE